MRDASSSTLAHPNSNCSSLLKILYLTVTTTISLETLYFKEFILISHVLDAREQGLAEIIADHNNFWHEEESHTFPNPLRHNQPWEGWFNASSPRPGRGSRKGRNRVQDCVHYPRLQAHLIWRRAQCCELVLVIIGARENLSGLELW